MFSKSRKNEQRQWRLKMRHQYCVVNFERKRGGLAV